MRVGTIALAALLAAHCAVCGEGVEWLKDGRFSWDVSKPLLAPVPSGDDFYFSIKDFSIVKGQSRWHLFCTVRGKTRSHQIEHISFDDWNDLSGATRRMLSITDKYYCAPQVFYFAPQKKWHLIYQAGDPSRPVQLQPAFSACDDLNQPDTWSGVEFLYDEHPANVKMWIDFWVICDDEKAHLFFTSLNGKLWRAETDLASFPKGWNQPKVVLEDDIFEAGHVYRIQETGKYIALIEAQNGVRRYYKAYLADRLDGAWTALANEKGHAFASPNNTHFDGERWSDSFSHGEMIRAGNDQRMEISQDRLRFIFQGVKEEDMKGLKYGEIPWRLGMLTSKSK